MMNKKRLAALAMSAVMAAGTVSIPVNAADFTSTPVQEDFTAGAAVQSLEPTEDNVDAVGAPVKDRTDSHWVTDKENPSVVITTTYEGEEPTEETVTKATEGAVFTLTEIKATCKEGAGYYWTLKYKDDEFKSPTVTEGQPAGHKYEDKIEDVWAGNCAAEVDSIDITDENIEDYKETKGYYKVQHVGKYCPECETWEAGAKYVKSEPEHLLDGKDIITYKPGNNTQLVDGDNTKVPELIEPTEPGEYTKITSQMCKKCNDTIEKSTETVKLDAKEDQVEDHISISDVENIDSAYAAAKLTGIKDAKDLPKNEDVVLADCNKEGSYVINYLTKDNKPLRTQTVTIAAHHVTKEGPTSRVKAVNKDDQKLLTWKWDAENKKMIVANSSCVKEVEYYVVTKCASNGLDSKGCSYETKSEKRTAAKSNNHTYNSDVYSKVNSFKETSHYDEFSKLEAIVEADKEHVKIVPVTATCEKAGTVNVEFYCVACGEKAKTIENVKVSKLDHEEVTKVENEVKATCTSAGSYTAVISCERCGEVISKKNVVIKRLAHTNEVGVNADGTSQGNKTTIEGSEASIKFIGSLVFGSGTDKNGTAIGKKYVPGDKFLGGANYFKDGSVITSGIVDTVIVTNCAVCHNNQVKVKDVSDVTVKAVKDETINKITGNVTAPGSITLTATYTEGNQTLTKEITLPYFSVAMDTTLAYTGLHKDVDGVYRYYVDGEFDEDYSGIVDFDGGQYVVANGVLCQDASGLNLVGDEWYLLTEGRIRTEVTQLVEYDGEWFFVANGKLDTSVNDLVEYDGETFVFVDGRLAQEGNGLWIGEEGVWYFLSNGRVAEEHTGLAMYDDEWFYVVEGKLAVDYSGTVEFEGGTFKVDHGMVKGQVK